MLTYKKNKKTAWWMIAVEGIICIILVVCFFANAMKREGLSTSAVQAGNEDSGEMMQHTIENLGNNGTDTAFLDLSGTAAGFLMKAIQSSQIMALNFRQSLELLQQTAPVRFF